MKNVLKPLKLWMLVAAAVIACCLLPRTTFAATSIANGETKAAAAGEILTFSLNSAKEVFFTGPSGALIRYGSNSACDYGSFNLVDGAASVSLTQGTWCFKLSVSGEVSVFWDENNDSPGNATEVRLSPGQTYTVDDEPKYRYYLLNVTDPSAKYTITMNNDVVHADIATGRVSTWSSAAVDYKIDQGKSATLVLKQGVYTICGTAFSKNVQFTIKRENWIGITRIIPSNNGRIEGHVGQTLDYVVNYEPKNANSALRVESVASTNVRMKLKSQGNGVAVFEVDYVNDTENKRYTNPYKKDETSRQYNRVRFVSEEGVTAIAEKIIGPEAPELWKTMTGSTKAISIPVTGRGNSYVAYYKNGTNWVQCGTSTHSNGVYYVNCKGLKAGKSYTFRVYAYSDGARGDYLEVKGVTAYNIKPIKAKATAKKAVFYKKKKDYEWKFDWNRGWYKVLYTDYTKHTVKISYKVPKKAKGMYVTVNGVKMKSGKNLSFTIGGKTKAGKKTTIIFQTCRKSGKCIAYGPNVKVKCKLKAAK